MKKHFTNIGVVLILMGVAFGVSSQSTSEVNLDASSINAVSTIFISPSSQEVLEGSTFDVSVFLDTKKVSINTIMLKLNFDQSKLNIVRPSSGKSIIGVWVESPTYSNNNGTMTLSGIIPNGIVTEGGLITTITFKAVSTGRTAITISPTSRILANNGLGSEVTSEFGRGQYTIVPKAPEGPEVFSDTHPFSGEWYNNNNASFGWVKTEAFAEFSYELDNKPFTVPENRGMTQETGVSFEGVADGLWYFHLKGSKNGVWGKTTHFLIRIDTNPPASFSPKVDLLNSNDRSLISFFTTDYLSGMDHYEVGVIEKSKSAEESPVFIQTESPYQLPLSAAGDLRVIVRAFDKAGNVRDEAIDLAAKESIMGFLKQNWVSITLAILLALLIMLVILCLMYLNGRRKRLILSYNYPFPRGALQTQSKRLASGGQRTFERQGLIRRQGPVEEAIATAKKQNSKEDAERIKGVQNAVEEKPVIEEQDKKTEQRKSFMEDIEHWANNQEN